MAYKKSSAKKQKILDTAYNLFEENGFKETNIKDIAKEADIVHSSIYYYFKNKEEIALELFNDSLIEIAEISDELSRNDSDLLLNLIVKYILIFRYLKSSKTAQEIYYDYNQYIYYLRENRFFLNSITDNVRNLFKEYNVEFSDRKMKAYLITSDGFAKSLFKGVLDNILDYNEEEAIDYFFRHMILNDIQIDETQYKNTLKKAFEYCNIRAL